MRDLTKREPKRGKFKCKKKSNLYPITELVVNGETTVDSGLWVNGIKDEFEGVRWRAADHKDSELFRSLQGDESERVDVSGHIVDKAVASLEKPLRLDIDGLCRGSLSAVLASDKRFVDFWKT